MRKNTGLGEFHSLLKLQCHWILRAHTRNERTQGLRTSVLQSGVPPRNGISKCFPARMVGHCRHTGLARHRLLTRSFWVDSRCLSHQVSLLGWPRQFMSHGLIWKVSLSAVVQVANVRVSATVDWSSRMLDLLYLTTK
jgi:hypothetical protein